MGFSSSDFFTPTNYFSGSYKFSLTKLFTISNDFTISTLFTQSNSYSQSVKFSFSNEFSLSTSFSKSHKFTVSNLFSQSTLFSDSNDFTQSESFSPTIKFSQSKPFTKTKDFTQSKIFSNSNQFSDSNDFSNSIYFSESIQFSPSEEPTPNPNPQCALYIDGELVLLDECDYSFDGTKNVYVYVLASNFTNFTKHDGNGGAIRLINSGITCNDTKFIDCISENGGGGGIYINNTLNEITNFTFVDLLFLRCKSHYGGAVFIYTGSEYSNVSFTRCDFFNNQAWSRKTIIQGKEYLFGGGAMFLICLKSNLINCTFTKNKGAGAVKIFDLLSLTSSVKLLNKDENLISFQNCNFEKDFDSKSSILFVGEKAENRINLNVCNFKGKLKEGSHYIDVKLHVKDKIDIKSCDFEHDENQAVNYELITDDIVWDLNSNNKYEPNLMIDNKMKIVFVILSITILISLIAVKKIISHNENDANELVCEKESFSNNLLINEDIL